MRTGLVAKSPFRREFRNWPSPDTPTSGRRGRYWGQSGHASSSHQIGSVLPEVLESIRRHFGVSHRVHDVFVAHVVLERPSVVSVVGELVACGVPEHVRVDRERELCRLPSPSDRFQKPRSRRRASALGHKHISRLHILAA